MFRSRFRDCLNDLVSLYHNNAPDCLTVVEIISTSKQALSLSYLVQQIQYKLDSDIGD